MHVLRCAKLCGVVLYTYSPLCNFTLSVYLCGYNYGGVRRDRQDSTQRRKMSDDQQKQSSNEAPPTKTSDNKDEQLSNMLNGASLLPVPERNKRNLQRR